MERRDFLLTSALGAAGLAFSGRVLARSSISVQKAVKFG
ncbi:MAG: twin-arginine translocation signal domain-containing protein, partial [Rhodothermaceae bacterium]|nr:twin-arginine translocation signal domain-containing protein [Rhodothermaceae bacterium]